MAFIRHIAISSDDPIKAAAFYKKHFGMTELFRQDNGAKGVWLSDGWIYFAIRKHDEDAPKLGPEQTSDYLGIHHIGFLVDDQEAKVKELDADNVRHVEENPNREKRPLAGLVEGAVNEKFIGPDWIHFDVRDRGWNEAIKSGMQLYELKPVTS